MRWAAVSKGAPRRKANAGALRSCAAALAFVSSLWPAGAMATGTLDYCVYAVNSSDESVSVIDPASGREGMRIFVDGVPIAIAFTPDHRTAYVANSYNLADDLALIDVPTKVVRKTITLPTSRLSDIEVHPSGEFVYVGTESNDGLYVLDAATDQVLARLPMRGIHQIAFAPDGRYALVSTQFEPQTLVIDTATHTVIGELPLTDTYGLGVTLDGAFTLTANGTFPGLLHVVNMFTRTITADINVDVIPTRIVMRPDGTKAYIGHGHGGASTLTVFDLRTLLVEASVEVGAGVFGVALSPDSDRIFATSATTDSVTVIDAATNTVIDQISVGRYPVDVGVAPEPGGCILPTPTSTATATSTETPTRTRTASPTITPRSTATPTVTDSPTITPGGPTLTPTRTRTPTMTATITPTPLTMSGPAFVVRRITPQPFAVSSSPRDLTSVGDQVFFIASTEATGQEVWRSDGTELGTRLVRDINPGEQDADPNDFIPLEDLLFFTASDSSNGEQLWRSDGTAEGTLQLSTGRRAILTLAAVDDGVAFLANEGGETRLWFSDGTPEGTVPVTEPLPSVVTSTPGMIGLGDSVMFGLARAQGGTTLWKSDLTASGTVAVKDIFAGQPNSWLSPVTAALGRVFFMAYGGFGSSVQLWVSDGTPDGTLSLEANGGEFGEFLALGDQLLFPAVDENGFELWATDGTKEGTARLKDIYPGPNGSNPTLAPDGVVGPYALIRAADADHGTELWRTDGSPTGTTLVKDIAPGAIDTFFGFGPVLNGALLFGADDRVHGGELWKTDATETGTVLVADIFPGMTASNPSFLGVLGTKAAFAARDATNGNELWCTDGTAGGTYLVRDLREGTGSSSPSNGIVHQGRLFFRADGGAGRELWISDCTPGGTRALANIAADFQGPQPSGFVAAENWMVFSGVLPPFGAELWKTDGTDVGTVPLGLDTIAYETLGDLVLTHETTGDRGVELWKYDLNTDEEGLVRDIAPLGASSSPFNLKRSGNFVYFSAFDSVHGTEPWRTDGSEAGTLLLRDIVAFVGSSDPMSFTDIGAKTLFASRALGELWVTDGTPQATQRVVAKQVVQPIFGDYRGVGDRLFFAGYTAASGGELWRSDGTAAGTALVTDLTPGTGDTQLLELSDARGELYFAADRGVEGLEPWRSDGSAAQTQLLKDIRPGTTQTFDGEMPADSWPREFTAVGSIVVFSAEDGVHGRELWRTNGSAAGTVLVKDINPGPPPSNPGSFVRVGTQIYFRACDTEGCELWVTDGTANGTQLFVDVLPGVLPSSPRDLTHVGALLYFSAYEDTSSRQLWAVEVGED